MRDRALGRCAEPALQSARSAAGCQSAARPRRHQQGKALNAKTQRERDYIDALGAMYVDHDKVEPPARVQAYANAMEQVALRYPKDDEAKIAYAIALNVSASPTDKTYANQLKGAALLEPIFARRPQASRRRALSDPPLRLSAARREGAQGGEALRQGRAGGAACTAHALAYLHARRLLEGIDRLECGIRARRQARRRNARSGARNGLSGLCTPATRAGQEGEASRR